MFILGSLNNSGSMSLGNSPMIVEGGFNNHSTGKIEAGGMCILGKEITNDGVINTKFVIAPNLDSFHGNGELHTSLLFTTKSGAELMHNIDAKEIVIIPDHSDDWTFTESANYVIDWRDAHPDYLL